MTIHTIALSAIEPPTANPRTSFDTDSIEGLAASIRADGLLQNLVVAPMKGKQERYRIISGERRYRALKLLEQQGTLQDGFTVPVDIRKGLSKDASLRIATVENLQRENLPPLDAAAALTRLAQDGEKLDSLVAQTGLSETTIRRRLALNALCETACRALAEGTISLAQAEALTLGDEEAQTRILEGIADGQDYGAAHIRDYLLDDKCPVSIAIFAREKYTGTYTSDLFADDSTTYFDDVEQFLTLQHEAVAELVEQYAETAEWIEVTDAYRIPAWHYREAEAGEAAGVLINLSPIGKVEILENLVPLAIDAEIAADPASDVASVRKPRAAYSATLCRYIAHHKSVAVQSLLLDNPRKAKEVAVLLLLGISDGHKTPLAVKPHEALRGLADTETPPTAYRTLEQRAEAAAERLGMTEVAEDTPAWKRLLRYATATGDLYEAVKALEGAELDALLVLIPTLCFGQGDCQMLDTEDSLLNRVACDLDADMRQHWRPDESFLKRRTRAQLLEIAAASGLSTTALPKKKAELVRKLERHFMQARAAENPTPSQRKANDWLPEAMGFPAVEEAVEPTA